MTNKPVCHVSLKLREARSFLNLLLQPNVVCHAFFIQILNLNLGGIFRCNCHYLYRTLNSKDTIKLIYVHWSNIHQHLKIPPRFRFSIWIKTINKPKTTQKGGNEKVKWKEEGEVTRNLGT